MSIFFILLFGSTILEMCFICSYNIFFGTVMFPGKIIVQLLVRKML